MNYYKQMLKDEKVQNDIMIKIEVNESIQKEF